MNDQHFFMFIGRYQHNIDDKGRLAVPVKFRQKLNAGAVVTRGLDSCLFLFSAEEWKKMADKLMNLPISQAKTRAFARLMLAGAFEVDFDSQGRINLPDYLMQYAGLKKKAVVAGLYNRIEIWDDKTWEAYSARTERESDKIAESLGELGV